MLPSTFRKTTLENIDWTAIAVELEARAARIRAEDEGTNSSRCGLTNELETGAAAARAFARLIAK